MKIILLICLIFTLTGCAEYQLYKSTIKHGGAQLADETLAIKLWGLCYSSSFGAIRRRFGDSPEQARALYIICRVEEINLLRTPEFDEF